MTNENINLVLTNSLCCIGKYAVKVSKLLSIGDKCADSEVIKLKLMNDYFNVAICYNNIIEINNTIISLTTQNPSFFYLNNISILNRSYVVIINGISYSFIGNGTSTILALLILKLTILNFYISHTQVNTNGVDSITSTLVTFILTCDVKSMMLFYNDGTGNTTTISGNLIQLGNCISVTNCLTEIEFEIIMNKLMDICEICPCQLI